MALLHPDKLEGVAQAAGTSVEQRAINVAQKPAKRLSPYEAIGQQKPDFMQNAAYELRDRHWANHLARLKARIAEAAQSRPVPKLGAEPLQKARKPKAPGTPAAAQIVIQLPRQ